MKGIQMNDDPMQPNLIRPARTTESPTRGSRRRRAFRALRDRVGRLQRLLAVAVFAALVGIGSAVFFATQPAPEPDAVLLGRGQAGVDFPSSDRPSSDRAPRDSAEPGQPAGSGEASYYGDELRGRPTASGESFDPEGLTAAHRTLPLGTRLRVTNVRNGESVVVRVNDRGPYSGDRVLDVSKRAARALGMLGSGTAPVRLELIPSVRG